MSSLTSAVAAVITDASGRVLLCQQSQGHRLWALPGGKIRDGESPVHAVIRDVLEETAVQTEIIDLIGLYQLTGNGCGDDLPDVLVHVFRARLDRADVTVNAPGRICRLSWQDPRSLPEHMTPTTRFAIQDAIAGRSGVLRDVERDAEPEIPEATDASAVPPQVPAFAG
ncbi:MAG TPA: NUDIX hydrolase [Micromonosporaceae bacterium]|jgi:ADP-ribose pyrophosphatase YjhB (NUDIX family)|nr:NUDIX hydrolase [Micromonosporaceae bacterium]